MGHKQTIRAYDFYGVLTNVAVREITDWLLQYLRHVSQDLVELIVHFVCSVM